MPSKKCQRCGKWHKSKFQQRNCFRIQKLHLSEAFEANIIRNQQIFQTEKLNDELLKQNILKSIEAPLAIENQNHLIFNNSSNNKFEIASIMKLLTLLTSYKIIKEKQIPLETKIIVPPLKLFEGQTKMHLSSGEQISILQLFKGIIIVSGGDAAQTLSFFIGNLYQVNRPHQKFIQLMKQTAISQQIQIEVVDCRGVKDGNICDLKNTIKLMKTIKKYRKIARLFQIKASKIRTSKNEKIIFHALTSTNPFISQKIYGKTGTTKDFNTNFVGYFQKDIRIFYFCIFDCRKGQRDLSIKKILSYLKTYGQQYDQ